MGELSITSLICHEDQDLFDVDDDDRNEVEHDHVVPLLPDNSNLLGSEDEYIEILVSSESRLCSVFCREDPIEIADNWLKWARSDSIQWIMKTKSYFSFSYQTAYLAMTYYDRFLIRRSIDQGKSWVLRLLSIACLSLAAKMDECIVPPLSEYQSEECKFDCNTIQRMELLILSTLEWRMSSVTPFSYLGHFISKLQIDNQSNEFVSKSIGFIFAIIDDVNLVDHRPSTIAAAAVLAASNQRLNKQLAESKLRIFSSYGALESENVFPCYTKMIKSCNDASLVTRSNKRRRLQLETCHEKLSP